MHAKYVDFEEERIAFLPTCKIRGVTRSSFRSFGIVIHDGVILAGGCFNDRFYSVSCSGYLDSLMVIRI